VGNDSGDGEGEEDESDDEAATAAAEKEEKPAEKEELNIPAEPVSIAEPPKLDIPPTLPPTPAQVDNTVVAPEAPVEQQANPPTIVIDDKPNVRFGEFDAVFDSDNPHGSDMIYDPKDGEEEVPALEILDEQGTTLAEGLDFDDLDEKPPAPEDLGAGDYEELG
jgi:hypothetical protein